VGIATESEVAWPDVRIRFALGVYSVAQQRWKTYGNFQTIGDASISPDGAKVAVVAGQREAPRLQILDPAVSTDSLHLPARVVVAEQGCLMCAPTFP